jgi:hypothetical protein
MAIGLIPVYPAALDRLVECRDQLPCALLRIGSSTGERGAGLFELGLQARQHPTIPHGAGFSLTGAFCGGAGICHRWCERGRENGRGCRGCQASRPIIREREQDEIQGNCQGGESNSRPRAYESPALPLSYPGAGKRDAQSSQGPAPFQAEKSAQNPFSAVFLLTVSSTAWVRSSGRFRTLLFCAGSPLTVTVGSAMALIVGRTVGLVRRNTI